MRKLSKASSPSAENLRQLRADITKLKRMKNFKSLSLLTFCLIFSQLSFAGSAVDHNPNVEKTPAMIAGEDFANALKDYKDFREHKKEMSRKDRKAKRKEVKKNLKQSVKALKEASDVDMTLLIILAILIPFLAMYLYEGAITNRFWISLILSLLFWIPGVIYTLIVILGGS